MNKILVAMDWTTCDECLYLNGDRWEYVGDTTVFASAIAHAAGGAPFVLEHREVERGDNEWPLSADDLVDDTGLYETAKPEPRQPITDPLKHEHAYRCVFRGQPEGIGNESTETVVELVHIVGTAPRDLGLQGGVDVRRDDILIQHTGGMRNLAWVKPHTLFETSDQAKAAAEAAPQTAPETAGGAPA